MTRDGCTLLITAVDNYIPFCIALSLLECLKGSSSSKVKVVVTAQDTDNVLVRRLKKKGAETREICYDDRQTVEDAVRGANVIVFFPEHDKERVRQARELADAAKDEDNLCGVMVNSIRGAGEGKQRLFKDYCEIEKIWKKETKSSSSETCLCVLRPSFLQDVMQLWSPHVEDCGTFNMTPSPRTRFTPLAMKDYAHVIYEILAKAHDRTVIQIDRRHHNMCYTLTGPESISFREMTEMVNDAIGEEDRIEYEQVDEEELKEYLRNLRHEDERREGGRRENKRDDDSVWYGLNRADRAVTKLIDGDRKFDKCVRKFYDGLDSIENAVRRLDGRNRGRQPIDEYRHNTRRQQDSQGRRTNDVIDMLDRLRHSGIEDADRMNTNERMRLANDVKRDLSRIADNLRRSGFEGEGRHEHKYPPIPLPIRPIEVDCVIDILRFIKEGRAERTTDDVEKITHREPQSIKDWFENNSDNFVPKCCEVWLKMLSMWFE